MKKRLSTPTQRTHVDLNPLPLSPCDHFSGGRDKNSPSWVGGADNNSAHREIASFLSSIRGKIREDMGF